METLYLWIWTPHTNELTGIGRFNLNTSRGVQKYAPVPDNPFGDNKITKSLGNYNRLNPLPQPQIRQPTAQKRHSNPTDDEIPSKVHKSPQVVVLPVDTSSMMPTADTSSVINTRQTVPLPTQPAERDSAQLPSINHSIQRQDFANILHPKENREDVIISESESEPENPDTVALDELVAQARERDPQYFDELYGDESSRSTDYGTYESDDSNYATHLEENANHARELLVPTSPLATPLDTLPNTWSQPNTPTVDSTQPPPVQMVEEIPVVKEQTPAPVIAAPPPPPPPPPVTININTAAPPSQLLDEITQGTTLRPPPAPPLAPREQLLQDIEQGTSKLKPRNERTLKPKPQEVLVGREALMDEIRKNPQLKPAAERILKPPAPEQFSQPNRAEEQQPPEENQHVGDLLKKAIDNFRLAVDPESDDDVEELRNEDEWQ